MNNDSLPVKSKSTKNIDMQGGKEEEMGLRDPFLQLHMGMPEDVGTFCVHFSALSTQIDGKSEADFAFHIEIGLSKFLGCILVMTVF